MPKLRYILLLSVVAICGCGSFEITEFWYGSVNLDYQFHPEIRPTVEKAMEDDKITWDELEEIDKAKFPQPTLKERLKTNIK